jgi:prevent-host-death family protein
MLFIWDGIKSTGDTMNQTISLNELPRKAEKLLRIAWEGHESVVLEKNGKPIAAVIPMDEYRRLYPETEPVDDETEQEPTPEDSLAYDLPEELLNTYHELVSKKLLNGLTSDEEAEFERVGAELDAADAATPLERNAWKAHERRMAELDELRAKRKMLLEQLQ